MPIISPWVGHRPAPPPQVWERTDAACAVCRCPVYVERNQCGEFYACPLCKAPRAADGSVPLVPGPEEVMS